MPKLYPASERMADLYADMTYSCIKGQFKNFRTQPREFAELAVDNFDLVKNNQTVKIPVKLFSKTWFNALKVMFLNSLSRKTPAEKQLRKMAKEEKIRKEYNI